MAKEGFSEARRDLPVRTAYQVGQEDFIFNKPMRWDRFESIDEQDEYEEGYRKECVDLCEAPRVFINGI